MKLRKKLSLFLFFLVVILPPGCSRSPEDQAVSELIDDASGILTEAEAIREENPAEADRLEDEAVARLEEAIVQYPASPLAAKLMEGKIKVNQRIFAELKDAEASRAARKEFAVRPGEAEEVDDITEEPFSRARKLVKRPGPAYFKASVLTELAGECRRRGEASAASEILDEALSFARSVERPFFKSRALAGIAGRYIADGDRDRAAEILTEALVPAREIDYPYFKSGSLAEIAVRLAEMERPEDAIEVAGEMEDHYFQARTLLEIAGSLIKAGEIERARPLLARARNEAEEIAAPHFQARILAGIAARRAAAGEAERTAELLDRALGLVDAEDNRISRIEALAEIAGSCAAAGDRERALETLGRAEESTGAIENNLLNDLLLEEIAERFIGIEEYERAAGITETMTTARRRALVLADLAGSYGARGETEEAGVFVSRCLKTAEEIKNPLFKAEVLIRLSGRYRPPEAGPGESEPEAPPEEDE